MSTQEINTNFASFLYSYYISMTAFSTMTYINAEEAWGTPQPLDKVSYLLAEGWEWKEGEIKNDGKWPIIIGEGDAIVREAHQEKFLSR